MQNLEFNVWFLGERSSLWRGGTRESNEKKGMYAFPPLIYDIKVEKLPFAGRVGPAGGSRGSQRGMGEVNTILYIYEK